MTWYTVRPIDHVQLIVVDLDRSRRLYEAVPGVIGLPRQAGG